MGGVTDRLEIVRGDITRLRVDAVVNAANRSLLGGGGVDGAIHRAAGWDQLQAACHKLGGCAPGDAKITPGFALRARHIIHTVGPMYRDGRHGEPDTLASCYRRALEVAVDHGLKTIAFPAISTGVYGYPSDAATHIALRTTAEFLGRHPEIERVIFVFYGPRVLSAAKAISARLRAEGEADISREGETP